MSRDKISETIQVLVNQRDYSGLLDYGLNAYDMGEENLTLDQRYAILMLLEVVIEEAMVLGKLKLTKNMIKFLEKGYDR